MTQTVIEFLNTASMLIPDFDGKFDNLRSFLDALQLLDTIKDTHEAVAVSLIKTKLKGTARNLISNEATVQQIILNLKSTIKGESVEVLKAKLMGLSQRGKDTNTYATEVDELTKALEFAYISDGVPNSIAAKYATNSAVAAIITNTPNERIKLIMESGSFNDMNEVMYKFISSCTAYRQQNEIFSLGFQYNDNSYLSNTYPNNLYLNAQKHRNTKNYRLNNNRYRNNRYRNSGSGDRSDNRDSHNMRYTTEDNSLEEEEAIDTSVIHEQPQKNFKEATTQTEQYRQELIGRDIVSESLKQEVNTFETYLKEAKNMANRKLLLKEQLSEKQQQISRTSSLPTIRQRLQSPPLPTIPQRSQSPTLPINKCTAPPAMQPKSKTLSLTTMQKKSSAPQTEANFSRDIADEKKYFNDLDKDVAQEGFSWKKLKPLIKIFGIRDAKIYRLFSR